MRNVRKSQEAFLHQEKKCLHPSFKPSVEGFKLLRDRGSAKEICRSYEEAEIQGVWLLLFSTADDSLTFFGVFIDPLVKGAQISSHLLFPSFFKFSQNKKGGLWTPLLLFHSGRQSRDGSSL